MNSVSTHTPAAAYNNSVFRVESSLAYLIRIRVAKKGCQRGDPNNVELFRGGGLLIPVAGNPLCQIR
jgi:hypothetical protein